MAEPKRYAPECGGAEVGANMIHIGDAHVPCLRQDRTIHLYVSDDDYITLSRERDELRRAFERAEADVQAISREVERLRKVEVAALALLEKHEDCWPTVFPKQVAALAEACGRKG